MKPLKLELSGFTCFRDRAVVSFEDLTLFAISGPTGSGKSSLLDAIIFALYGQTPRLGKKGLAALLNPNAEGLYVVFEFEAGGGIYRAVRTLRQTRSATVAQPRIEMQQPDASWKQLPETGIAEINSRLESIVGLDYESFTRAVLLPQGEFSKFLHGGAEAGALLIRLLGLERIKEMQREAGSRASAAKSRQGFIAAQLEHDLADATPERLRELKDKRTALGARETELKALGESLSAALQEQEKIKALTDDLAGVRVRLQALRAQEAKIANDRVALRRAHDAALITPQLDILDERRGRLKRTEESERSLQEALKAQERALKEVEEVLRSAERGARRIPDLGERLEALAALAPLLGRLRSLGGTVALADRADKGVSYSEEAWQALQGLTLSLPGLRSARRQVEEGLQALGKTERAVKATAAEITTLSEQLDALTRQGRAAREAAEAASRRYREAEDGNRALALRRHLHAGETCPVCEQVVKRVPSAGDEVDLNALELARDEAAETLDALKTGYRDTKGKLEGAQDRLADRKESLKHVQEQLKGHEQALREAEAPFREFGGLTKGDALMETRLMETEAMAKALERRRMLLLTSLAKEVREGARGLDPERAPAQLRAERKGLEEALLEAQQRMQEKRSERDRLNMTRRAQEEKRSEYERDVKRAEGALAPALAQAGFASAEEVREASLSKAALQALEAAIESYRQGRKSAEDDEANLIARLAGRTLDETAFKALKTRKADAVRELEAVQQELGSLAERLRTLELEVARAKALRKELQDLGKSYDTYYQLSLDLRGSNFQDYLLTRVQGQLAYRASAIMRETTEGRYDLRLLDGEYQVLDAWHTGEPRRVRTLSGGETFIASLALALALSETIAGNTVLGALFLDEGFGTLDAETLAAVAGVLESLTEQGRIVGIITHVSELSERLPDRLRVHKGAKGSTVAWDL